MLFGNPFVGFFRGACRRGFGNGIAVGRPELDDNDDYGVCIFPARNRKEMSKFLSKYSSPQIGRASYRERVSSLV